MTCSIEQLTNDVMARLGEKARPQSSQQSVKFPSAREAVASTIRIRLAEIGKSLILNADADQLGDCVSLTLGGAAVQLPSGQYGLDVKLPADTLRVVSVMASEWERPAQRVISAGDPAWERQWSWEPGIAGCRQRPMAYLSVSGVGLSLRATGCDDPFESIEVRLWRLLDLDSEGKFYFPCLLYPELVGQLSSCRQSIF